MLDEVITQQQSDMITMLINGENIADIARRLNINRNTVYNWMKKDHIRAELDRRKQDLTRQGNQMILKDLSTYIGNIKAIANDKTDKRTCLAANQYLINRVYGNPTNNLDVNSNGDETEMESIDDLAVELNNFKIRRVK